MPSTPRVDDARATRALVIINCAIFLFLEFLPPWQKEMLQWRFGLSGMGLEAGLWIQVVTYQFLHGNLLHLVMNMVGLWFAGREVERLIGTRNFLLLYFAGGILGGLAQLAVVPSTPVLIGASAAVFAVLLALTTFIPELPITALIFFVLPIRMRAKYLGLGIVAASVLLWVTGVDPHVGHAAHLAGALVGFLYARTYVMFHPDIPSYPIRMARDVTYDVFRPTPEKPPIISAPVRKFGEEPTFEVLRPDENPTLDAILRKVLAHGIHSLTREERRVLEESRGRKRRRF